MECIEQPGDTFESGAPGWQLGGASVIEGNEPFYVHGAGESRSLSIPAGGSAESSTVCVGLNEPTVRFFARSSGSPLSALRVEASFEDALGNVRTVPIWRTPGMRSGPRSCWRSPGVRIPSIVQVETETAAIAA